MMVFGQESQLARNDVAKVAGIKTPKVGSFCFSAWWIHLPMLKNRT